MECKRNKRQVKKREIKLEETEVKDPLSCPDTQICFMVNYCFDSMSLQQCREKRAERACVCVCVCGRLADAIFSETLRLLS